MYKHIQHLSLALVLLFLGMGCGSASQPVEEQENKVQNEVLTKSFDLEYISFAIPVPSNYEIVSTPTSVDITSPDAGTDTESATEQVIITTDTELPLTQEQFAACLDEAISTITCSQNNQWNIIAIVDEGGEEYISFKTLDESRYIVLQETYRITDNLAKYNYYLPSEGQQMWLDELNNSLEITNTVTLPKVVERNFVLEGGKVSFSMNVPSAYAVLERESSVTVYSADFLDGNPVEQVKISIVNETVDEDEVLKVLSDGRSLALTKQFLTAFPESDLYTYYRLDNVDIADQIKASLR